MSLIRSVKKGYSIHLALIRDDCVSVEVTVPDGQRIARTVDLTGRNEVDDPQLDVVIYDAVLRADAVINQRKEQR